MKYELTHPQKRILYTQKIYPDLPICNIGGICNIAGAGDLDMLETAINIFIDKNDVFKLKFYTYDDKPYQYLEDHTHKIINKVDFTKSPHDFKEWCREFMDTKFILEEGHLYKFGIFKLSDGKFGFIMNLHHMISDAWSFSVLIEGITLLYSKLLNGEEINIDNNSSYIDYIKAEEKYVSSESFIKDKNFWDSKFSNINETSLFKDTHNAKGECQKFSLKLSTVESLNKFLAINKISKNSMFLALNFIYLYKTTGECDLTIGIPVYNRPNKKFKTMMGMFVSTVPIKIHIDPQKTFIDFIAELNNELKNCYRHQKYPYDLLIDDLKISEKGFDGLFKIIFNYYNTSLRFDVNGGKTSCKEISPKDGTFPLNFILREWGDENSIEFELNYRTCEFSNYEIKLMYSSIINMLNDILINGDKSISNVQMISSMEKEKILYEFNSKPSISSIGTIAEEFLKQAIKTPNNIAVVYKGGTLTYKQLNGKANNLAKILKTKGVITEDVIVIAAEKSLNMIVGILAILKSGAAYLPIDLEYPQNRINYILKDSKAKLILLNNETPIDVNLEKVFINNEQLPTESHEIDLEKNNIDSLAYIMYTSGSTGAPKGVAIVNKNVVRLVKNTNYIKFQEGDTIGQSGSIAFDAATFEIWGALLNGLTLHILDKETLLNVEKLKESISHDKIDILWLTSPLFNQICEFDVNVFDGLHYLLVGGDVVSPKYVNKLKIANKDISIINGYGPTENTTFSTCYNIPNEWDAKVSIPIGSPISGSTAFVVDADNNLQPIGIPGELCVSGDGLARGYINNMSLTVDKFVDNCFEAGKKMYKTGDIAKWLKDGNIQYLGRKDNQVKISGFRIEITEVEKCILMIQEIREAIVLAHNNKGNKELCCYYVCGNDFNTDKIKENLKEVLPKYMIPSYFIRLDKMPLTINGKINKDQLPIPDFCKNTLVKYEECRTDIEKELKDIWQRVLGVDNIGINHSFIDLGGNSLKAMALSGEIRKAFGVSIPLRKFIEDISIAKLGEYINNEAIKSYENIEIVEQAPYYKTSSAQKRMYILNNMNKESITYNIPVAFEIEGILDIDKFKVSILKIIERHESLRTSFANISGSIVQKVNNFDDFTFNIDIENGVTEDNIKKNIDCFIKPFKLCSNSLIRVKLLCINSTKHILLVDMHHIIADGVSLQIFMNELKNLYENKPLDEIKIQYKDFSNWQNSFCSNRYGELLKQEKFWTNQLKGMQVLNLPTDYIRPSIQNYSGNTIEFKLPGELTNKIGSLAKQTGTTPYIILMSAFNILLSKYSSQEEIVIGTPVSGRDHTNLQNIVGMFVNTLVIRSNVDSNENFISYLQKLKDIVFQSIENSRYQFDQLIDKLKIERDPSRNPIFDVMFVWNQLNIDHSNIGATTLKRVPIENTVSKFCLTMNAIQCENEINFSIEYETKLFREETIYSMIKHYLNIVKAICENIQIPIKNIQLLEEEEQYKILSTFNDTHLEYPSDKTIDFLFEKQVRKTPNNIALVFNEEVLTYEELDNKSNHLANILIQNGVKAEDIVAVLMSKSVDYIISILSILKAGAAFLPIDVSYPSDRIEYMLSDSGAKILLVSNDADEFVENKLRVINIRNLEYDDANIGSIVPNVKNSSNLAYVIYTSGSSGKPKGVLIEHKGICNLMLLHHDVMGINENDRIIQFASISFDASVWEIFMALLNGASLYLVDKDITCDTSLFENYLNDNNITVATLPPVYLNNLDHSNIHFLRILITAGATISKSTLNPWFNKVRYINAYGPTETTICSTIWIHDKTDKLCDFKSVPIGKPIINSKIYILDTYNNIQAIGVPGEICVSGDMISRGYLNREELNKEKFIANPFIQGKYMYRTGDLAKWKSNGDIEYIGRIDDQIKLHGYRIEPSEIEYIISVYSNIEDVAVICKSVNNDTILIAYYTAIKTIDNDMLKTFLKEKLPEYMIPNILVQIHEFVLDNSGKIDKKHLQTMDICQSNKDIDKSSNPTEAKLFKIWVEVLGNADFGVTNSFFQSGGSSITLIQIIAQIKKEFNVNIGFKEFMIGKDIRSIANLIANRKKNAKEDYETIIHDNEHINEPFPLTEVQMAYLLGRNKNIEMGGRGTHAYTEVQSKLDINQLNKSFNKVIKRHGMLRTIILDSGQQKILSHSPHYEITVRDLSALSETHLNNEIIKERERMAHHVFNYNKWPLFEIKAYKISSFENYIFISFDGLIADGSSLQIVSKELMDFYYNRDELYSDLDINFRDYILAYKRLQHSKSYNEDKQYWLSKLDDFPMAPQLPLKVNPETVKEPHFERLTTTISKENWDIINKICIEHDITPSVLFCTIYGDILSFWSNENNIAVNLSVFNRYPFHKQVNDIVGDFTSIILVDIHNDYNSSFFERCHNVQNTILEALEHRKYDGIEFIREFSKKHLLSNKAVMPIVFTSMISNNESEGAASGADSLGIIKYGISQTPQVYIDQQIYNNKKGDIILNWDYVEEIFDENIIKPMFQQYVDSVYKLLDYGNIDKQMITKVQTKFIEKYNDTNGAINKYTLQELFEKQVKKTPYNCAIELNDEKITYIELHKKSNKIARYLMENHVCDNMLIGVIAKRSIETIANLLGIVKAGCAYVPIDPAYPSDRIDYIIKNSNIDIILDEDTYRNDNIDTISNYDVKLNYSLDDIAYVIYTSGSTGNPKGVVINQKAAVNTILDINKRFNVNNKDRIIGLSSMCFDLSVYDIFGSLICGATLVMLDDQRDIENVYSTILTKGITIWNSVPSTMEMLVTYIGNISNNKEFSVDNISQLDDYLDQQLFWSPSKVWKICNNKIFIDNEEVSQNIRVAFPDIYFLTQSGATPREIIQDISSSSNNKLSEIIHYLIKQKVLITGILDPHQVFSSLTKLYDKDVNDETIFIKEKYDEFKKEKLNRVIVSNPQKKIHLCSNIEYPTNISCRKSYRYFDKSPIKFIEFSKLISILRQEKNNSEIRYNYASAGGLYPIDIYIYIKDNRIGDIPIL